MTQPFSDEAIASVATAHGVSEGSLRDAAVAVQATLAEYPGRTLDGLVYEWRQAFRHDPILERTADGWELRVPESAWADVRSRARIDEHVVEALLALHETRAATPESDQNDAPGVVLVLARD